MNNAWAIFMNAGFWLRQNESPSYEGLPVDGLLNVYAKQRTADQLHIQRLLGVRIAEEIMKGQHTVRHILTDFREKAPTLLEQIDQKQRAEAQASGSSGVPFAIFDGESREPSLPEQKEMIITLDGLARVAVYMGAIKTLMMKLHGFEFADYKRYRDNFNLAMHGLMAEKVDGAGAEGAQRTKQHIATFEDFTAMLEEDIDWFARG